MVRVKDIFNGGSREVAADELEFRVSAYGVLIEKGKLLVQINPRLKKYNLPGGKLEKGEPTLDGLKREFKEETGLMVEPTKLLKVKESFIDLGEGNAYHSVLIFYKVKRVGGVLGQIEDADDSVEAKFIQIDSSLDAKLQEVFRGVVYPV